MPIKKNYLLCSELESKKIKIQGTSPGLGSLQLRLKNQNHKRGTSHFLTLYHLLQRDKSQIRAGINYPGFKCIRTDSHFQLRYPPLKMDHLIRCSQKQITARINTTAGNTDCIPNTVCVFGMALSCLNIPLKTIQSLNNFFWSFPLWCSELQFIKTKIIGVKNGALQFSHGFLKASKPSHTGQAEVDEMCSTALEESSFLVSWCTAEKQLALLEVRLSKQQRTPTTKET